jgi:hypothetical protein
LFFDDEAAPTETGANVLVCPCVRRCGGGGVGGGGVGDERGRRWRRPASERPRRRGEALKKM